MTAPAPAAAPPADAETHVVVSESMRALYRSLKKTGSAPPPGTPTPEMPRAVSAHRESAGPAAEPARTPDAVPPDAAKPAPSHASWPWRRLRLRRDGRRPLVTDALPLLSRAAETSCAPSGPEAGAAPVALTQRVDLVLTRSGEIVACLALTVPDGAPARPLHSVAAIGSAEDLDRLVARHDPARALPEPPAASCEETARLADRLRGDLQALLRAALGAAPLAISRPDGDPE
jgi:hypothetical protein